MFPTPSGHIVLAGIDFGKRVLQVKAKVEKDSLLTVEQRNNQGTNKGFFCNLNETQIEMKVHAHVGTYLYCIVICMPI